MYSPTLEGRLSMADKERPEEEEVQLVVFQLGNEEYGAAIGQVQEIVNLGEVTRMPKAHAFVEGVINLRGRVVPVIDIGKRFDLPLKERDKNARIMVVLIEGVAMGMIVDSISEVLRLSKEAIEPPPPIIGDISTTYIKGVGKVGDRLVTLVDLDKVLTTEEVPELKKIISEESGA